MPSGSDSLINHKNGGSANGDNEPLHELYTIIGTYKPISAEKTRLAAGDDGEGGFFLVVRQGIPKYIYQVDGQSKAASPEIRNTYNERR